MNYGTRNTGTDLEQAQKCGGVKLVNSLKKYKNQRFRGYDHFCQYFMTHEQWIMNGK